MDPTLFSVIGNIGSSMINASLQANQNEYNHYLAKEQNQENRINWYNAMGYNAPINQVERLKSAGLNPALMYGNGLENVAPSAPDMVSSQGVAPNIGSPFANLARDMQNQQLVDSQVRLNDSAAQRNLADAGLKEVQIDIAGVNFQIMQKNGIAMSDARLENLRTNTEMLQSTIQNIDQDTAIKVLEEKRLDKYIAEQMPAEIEKLKSETGLNEAQAKQILELLPYEILLKKATANNANAQARLAKANAEFQEKLNASDQYVKDFIQSVHIDNMGKLVSVAINAGTNNNAMRYGGYNLGIKGLYTDQYDIGNASLIETGEVLGCLGRLFSFIIK